MVAKTSPLLIIASHNTGKIKEFQQVLGAHWRVQPQADFAVTEAEETGSTFVENALIKARHACLQTGHAALADDSGLVVPALGGAPGLRSARYSGSGYEDNNTLLLNNMAGLQGANRHAFYIAVLVLLRDAQDPTPLIAEGRWQGRIANVPRGEGGFGYDPIFIPEGGSLHAAEMTPDEKNRISHRAKAISTLLALADD
ncbi:RdgB/HAM1 family non-canonical purine NTP pyrophosphatase [Luminiphilus sp.]|nr:RdgB/HAM1 family non-canonical purine NTP pyrophosphatase [Luminiphilus sp.]MDA8985737.1 RdgB/HAM1 family non-canonical purine NTP pyrophosphatase [Luminiphilus sp.]MDB2644498.1 RdgB/HAM1 family non-canonical purine NTP pyrophosphatase [Luminiphilus sp.]